MTYRSSSTTTARTTQPTILMRLPPKLPAVEHKGLRLLPLEGGEPRDRAAQDQRVHVMRALVGVDRLKIGGVAHHVELGADAVAAMHVACDPGDIQRLPAIVALQEADRLGDQLAFLEPASDAERSLQAERDLRHHVGQLELDELVGGEGLAELLPVERVLPGCSETGLGGTHRAP